MDSENHENPDIDPIEAVVKKDAVLEQLITNGLAIPIYQKIINGMQESQTRQPGEDFSVSKKTLLEEHKLVAAFIPISDDEIIITRIGNLQMQVLKLSPNFLRPESSYQHILSIGSINMDLQIDKYPLHKVFEYTIDHYGTSILADSSTQPLLVTQKLTEGLSWIKNKQETHLKNRSQAANSFSDIIQKFFEPDQNH